MVLHSQTLLPQGRSGPLLPTVHGFRLCRSSAQCIHSAQRCRLRSRLPLRVRSMSVVAEPVPLEFLSFSGDAQGLKELSLQTADAKKATGLVHRYVTLAQQNARRGTASTLTRSEVRGGGRKPFAQKGTGNARQGSIRTPLKPGGGVVFGPKPRDWSIKMNKKERRLAYATALQNAAESIVVVEDLEGTLTQPRTRELVQALRRWGVEEEEHALIIVDHMFSTLNLAGRNISRLTFNTINNLSVYDLLRADKVIIESSALAFIQDFYGGPRKAAESAATPAESSQPDEAPADTAQPSEPTAEQE